MNYVSRLGLAREPFSNSPDPGFLYHSKQHTDCLQQVEIAVRLRRGLNVVLGDIGTGKTTLCRTFLLSMGTGDDTSVHLLLDPPSRSQRFFLHVLYGIFTGREADRRLNEWQLKEGIKKALFQQAVEEGKLVVLIIDEGQKLSKGCLEILRELLNYETNSSKLLQIVIFAQRELEPVLARMPNLLDRVNCMHRLQPLDREDSEAMIRFRVAQASPDPHNPPKLFSSGACKAIHRAAEGYPRRMVRLCHKSLIEALVRDDQMVGGTIVRSVVKRERKEGTLSARATFGGMFRAAGLAVVLAGSVLVTGLILGPGLQERLFGTENATVRMEVSKPLAKAKNVAVAPGEGVQPAEVAPDTQAPNDDAPGAVAQAGENQAGENQTGVNQTGGDKAGQSGKEQGVSDSSSPSEGGVVADSGHVVDTPAVVESADLPAVPESAPAGAANTSSEATNTPAEAAKQSGLSNDMAVAPQDGTSQDVGAGEDTGVEPVGKSLVDRVLAFFFSNDETPKTEDPERYASDIVIPDTPTDSAESGVTGQTGQETEVLVATEASGEAASSAEVTVIEETAPGSADTASSDTEIVDENVTVFQTTTQSLPDTDMPDGGTVTADAGAAMAETENAVADATVDRTVNAAVKDSAPEVVGASEAGGMSEQPAVVESATGKDQAARESSEMQAQAPAEMPENLGQMKMPRGYSLSSVLRRVYGIYSGDLLRTFKAANPRVKNLNNIPVGKRLVMPLAGPDKPDGFDRLVWVSLTREPSLQKAFDRLREYIDTGWPIRLLCTISGGKVAYRVVLTDVSTDREGAMGVLGALPPSLQQGAEIFEPTRDMHFVGWLDKASRELAERQ